MNEEIVNKLNKVVEALHWFFCLFGFTGLGVIASTLFAATLGNFINLSLVAFILLASVPVTVVSGVGLVRTAKYLKNAY